MGAELREFAPHIAALLVGGLASSLGLGRLARTRRGRAALARIRMWGVALVGLASAGVGIVALMWMVRRVVETGTEQAAFPAPLELLLFGIGLGLPLALPGVLMTWNEVRPEKVAERNRRIASATKDDRRAFAEQLLEGKGKGGSGPGWWTRV
jgi:hypothetical protein